MSLAVRVFLSGCTFHRTFGRFGAGRWLLCNHSSPFSSSSERVSWFMPRAGTELAEAVALQLCEHDWIRCLWFLQERWMRMNDSVMESQCVCFDLHSHVSPPHCQMLSFSHFITSWLIVIHLYVATVKVCHTWSWYFWSNADLSVGMTPLSSACQIHSSRESGKHY